MIASDLEKIARDFVNSPANLVPEDKALSPRLAGMPIYEEPLFGYAAAADGGFAELNNPGVRLEGFMPPQQWLPGAQTVISFFLPLSAPVRESNKIDMEWPSPEWLHGRIEGQGFIVALSRLLCGALGERGYAAVAPALDQRFWSRAKPDPAQNEQGFTSNWSERHVAYVCGLGTFSLAKGIITARGTAGRLGSLITDLSLPPTPRPYSQVYEYCLMCGVCAANCPAQAISVENGKDHMACCTFVDATREQRPPYYGCGKCQVGVPCETGKPVA